MENELKELGYLDEDENLTSDDMNSNKWSFFVDNFMVINIIYLIFLRLSYIILYEI